MIYRVVTYWKCGDIYSVFDIGAFEDKARAYEVGSQVLALQSSAGKAVVKLKNAADFAVDNSHVIFFRSTHPGEVDPDIDLPGPLDHLLGSGWEFVRAANPVVTRNPLINNDISGASNSA